MGFERPGADTQHQVTAILRRRHGESCLGTHPHFAAPGQTQNRSLRACRHRGIPGKPAARLYHGPRASGNDRHEGRLRSLGESRDRGSFDVPPGLGHGVHANQQPLTLAVAAVAHGMYQVHDYAGHRRRLLKLVYAHRAHLLAAYLEPLAAATGSRCMRKVDDQPGRAVEELESRDWGVWLETISSAGPSASEIIFTERRTAGGPLGTGRSSGVCARPSRRPA